MKKQRIVLIGGGGHCKVVIDALFKLDEFYIEGIIDNKLHVGDRICNVEVIGDDNKLVKIYNKGIENAFVTVGSVGDCSCRKKIYDNLKTIGFNLPIIIHPFSVIGIDCQIGEGTFVAAGAVVNPNVKIGKNVIVNTNSSVDHDCWIGDFVHIAPGVTLSGSVKVGEGTHIGIGANVVQGVNIGKNCMVKAATLVFQDLDDGTIRHRDSVNSAGGSKSREF